MEKKYNEIPVKDNMKIEQDNNGEEVVNTEKKEIKRVTNVQPKKVKRGLFGRLVTGIVGPEGLPGIGAYVNDEIIKPAIKNIIVDAVTSGINMIMYGDRGHRGGHNRHSGPRRDYQPRTNYNSRYAASNQEPERRVVRTSRYGVEEYILDDRLEAANALTGLQEYAERYGSVSIADYYEMIGVPSQYTDNNYGWTVEAISRASIIPTRGGYIIKFPQVEAL